MNPLEGQRHLVIRMFAISKPTLHSLSTHLCFNTSQAQAVSFMHRMRQEHTSVSDRQSFISALMDPEKAVLLY